MPEWLFWLILLAIALFLWWLAYYATKRMYIKKKEAAQAGVAKPEDAATQPVDKTLNMEES